VPTKRKRSESVIFSTTVEIKWLEKPRSTILQACGRVTSSIFHQMGWDTMLTCHVLGGFVTRWEPRLLSDSTAP
jgi:hypothetical protein